MTPESQMKRPNHGKKMPGAASPREKTWRGQAGEHKRDALPQAAVGAAGAGGKTARGTREIIAFAMGVCVVYYVFVITSAHGDFQGDSYEYLTIASNMKKGVFTVASYDYRRGLLYPWFLSVTWGHQGFLTYFTPATLFLTSFYFALRVLALNSIYCLLPIAAALIPAVTFLERQIYPDGLLMSLTLVFLICLAKRRWTLCSALGLVLALIKLIFICVLPVGLVVFLFTKKIINFRALAYCTLAGIISLPICIVLFSNVFVDRGYMVIFARPYSHGYPLEETFPDKELRIMCGGIQHAIPRKDLYFDPITVPFTDALYGPLTQEQARGLGCTDADARPMKRSLLMAEFVHNPLLHTKLAAEHFARSLIGAYYFGHVSYILRYRQDLWSAHYDKLGSFSPYELTLLEEYKRNGFQVADKEMPLSFALNEFSVGAGELVVRAAALGILGLCIILGSRRGILRELAQDPVNIGMTLFLIVYSYLVALSTPFVYDRYTLVNLVILCILAARIAATTLPAKRASAKPIAPF